MPAKTANGNVASPPASASPIGTVPVGSHPAPIPPRFLSSNHSVRSAGDAGDIILGEEKPAGKIPKKFLIIGAVAAVALATVGITALLVSTGSKQAEVIDVAAVTAEAKQEFYEFANYLISGEVSTADPHQGLKKPYYSQLYAVTRDDDAEAMRTFFDRAQELLDAFAQNAQKLQEADSDSDKPWDSLAEMVQEQLSAFRAYAETDYYSSVTMMALYLSSGAKVMTQTVDNAYSELAESTHATLAEIATTKIQIAADVKSLFDFYTAQGCLDDDSASASCGELSDETAALQAEINELDLKALDAEKKLLTDLFAGCLNIYNLAFDGLSTEGGQE